MKTLTSLDSTGIGLSALCIVHCLFLPLIGTSLPLLVVFSENEWVHKVLVLLVLPVAFSLVLSAVKIHVRILAVLGLALLLAAAFIPVLHDFETMITVTGALMLAAAHIFRLTQKTHCH